MSNIGVVIPSHLPTGIALPQIGRLAREAEMARLDCIWAEDHLADGDAAVLDPIGVVAASAAATRENRGRLSGFRPLVAQPLLGAQASRNLGRFTSPRRCVAQRCKRSVLAQPRIQVAHT